MTKCARIQRVGSGNDVARRFYQGMKAKNIEFRLSLLLTLHKVLTLGHKSWNY